MLKIDFINLDVECEGGCEGASLQLEGDGQGRPVYHRDGGQYHK